jgi:flagellar motor switch protein FliM
MKAIVNQKTAVHTRIRYVFKIHHIIPGGKGRPARKADKLTAICKPIVQKMWELRRLKTLWASMACYRDSFT